MADIEDKHDDAESVDDLEEVAPFNVNMCEYHILPEPIKKRVLALKNLQYKTIELDVEFYKRLYQLEKEFEDRHQKLFDERTAIVQGDKEPTEEESNFDESALEETFSKMTKEMSEMVVSDMPSADAKGIPDFWYKALRHVPHLETMIMKCDIPILKHLVDVKCEISPESNPGFTLEFHFTTNEYFSNQKLTKQYFFTYDIPKEEPFDYTGPEITACQGCVIEWNKGKDVTVKQVKKMQKHKKGGEKRVIFKTAKADSFFNFFNPEKQSIDDADDDMMAFLEFDFKVGQFIRESIIPQAVLYYTGEAEDELEDDEDDEDFEDSEMDDDDESDGDDDDDDEDTHLHKAHNMKKSKQKGRHGPQNNKGGDNPECKQQ